MGIQYVPKQADKCWPEGDYEAVLMSVDETVSKSSGADMEVWQIGCYHPDGREQTIKEYVTASAAFKIKQLATALGKKGDFEAGRFHAEDYVNSSFTVALGVEASDGYADKNRVAKFKARATTPTPTKTPANPRPPANNLTGAIREKIASRPAPLDPFPDDQTFRDNDIPF